MPAEVAVGVIIAAAKTVFENFDHSFALEAGS